MIGVRVGGGREREGRSGGVGEGHVAELFQGRGLSLAVVYPTFPIVHSRLAVRRSRGNSLILRFQNFTFFIYTRCFLLLFRFFVFFYLSFSSLRNSRIEFFSFYSTLPSSQIFQVNSFTET